MPNITNLTNFNASPSQAAAGVENLQDASELRSLLRFDEIPSKEEIHDRAERIADIAQGTGNDTAMISGAPYLMSALENALEERGITPVYSFSERVSADRHNPDGTVTKQSVFEHKSFVDTSSVKIDATDNKVDVRNGGILNLTQHDATDAQRAAGVVEPDNKADIRADLTFRGGADRESIEAKANDIADRAVESGCGKAMIGGAPYLMSALETALTARGIEPVYAFSERNIVARENPDGTTSTQVVFEHKGFVEVEPKEPAGVDNEKDSVSTDDRDDADREDPDSVDNDSGDWDLDGLSDILEADDDSADSHEDSVNGSTVDDDADDVSDDDDDYDPVD